MTTFVRFGQSTLSPIAYTHRKEVLLPVYVDARGYIQNAGLVHQPIPALEKGPMVGPRAVVMHRTVSSTASSTLSAFRRGIGTHFLIGKDGVTYQTASLHQKTQHVGPIRSRCYEEGSCPQNEAVQVRAWTRTEAYRAIHNHEKSKGYPGRYPMNEDSVGIEVVAMWTPDTGWEQPTQPQRESIQRLVQTLQILYPLTDADVYEHDEISRKTPGEGAGLYDGADDDGMPVRFPPPIL